MIESRIANVTLGVLLGLTSTASTSSAQHVDQPPNAKVTVVNANTGLITAKPIAPGPVFSFKFDPGQVPFTINIDQKVWRRDERVSFNADYDFCCTIAPAEASYGRPLRTKPFTTYAAESTSHSLECDGVAQRSFPRGGHRCFPKATLISSGKNPDGSGATYSWTCACS